jgi:RNA polymerase sigma-70 factor, ECF subfamily
MPVGPVAPGSSTRQEIGEDGRPTRSPRTLKFARSAPLLTLTLDHFDCKAARMKMDSWIDGVLARLDNDNAVGARECMVELIDVIHNHRTHIFRFLLVSLGDPELARTLTERCVETACSEWRPFWDKSRTRLRLMRIAVDLERRCWRKQQLCFWRKTHLKAVGLELLNEFPYNDLQLVEYRFRAREQVRHVWNAVRTMKNEQRVVFLLYFVEEMDRCEVAEATGLDQITITVLLSAALRITRATFTCKAVP